MISHDSLRFDQRPQSLCSHTQRRPALVLLPHLATSAQTACRLHRSSSRSSLAIPLSSPTLPAKTAAVPAHPHLNPIDRPASTAPAAHFKRLYRNCPKKAHPTHTSSRGSHDRVLTFCGHCGNDAPVLGAGYFWLATIHPQSLDILLTHERWNGITRLSPEQPEPPASRTASCGFDLVRESLVRRCARH